MREVVVMEVHGNSPLHRKAVKGCGLKLGKLSGDFFSSPNIQNTKSFHRYDGTPGDFLGVPHVHIKKRVAWGRKHGQAGESCPGFIGNNCLVSETANFVAAKRWCSLVSSTPELSKRLPRRKRRGSPSLNESPLHPLPSAFRHDDARTDPRSSPSCPAPCRTRRFPRAT